MSFNEKQAVVTATEIVDYVFKGSAPIGSRFGPRTPIQTPNGLTSNYHKGQDSHKPEMTPIIAPVAGSIVVFDEQPFDGNGYHTQLLTDDGWLFVFLHLHINAPRLTVGTKVRAGDIIGFVGTTGLSTGYHLHWEVLPPPSVPVDKAFEFGQAERYVGAHQGWIDPIGTRALAYVNKSRSKALAASMRPTQAEYEIGCTNAYFGVLGWKLTVNGKNNWTIAGPQ